MHFRNVKFEGKKDNGGPWCYLSNDEDILAVGKTWDYCNVIESCPEADTSDANPGKKLTDKVGASSRWSFGPNSAWGRRETTTIRKTHSTLYSITRYLTFS